MKLKNKYTKKIDNWCIDKDVIRTCDGSIVYHTIAELIEAGWEDVPEEPKEYWYISDFGAVRECEIGKFPEDEEDRKEIGNYFDTKEEAERVVEKLKAWKRLKDKGFRFDGYDVAHKSNGNLAGQIFYDAGNYCIGDVEKDLDLLFGGEE